MTIQTDDFAPAPKRVVQCFLQNVGVDDPGEVDQRARGCGDRDPIDDG